MSSMAVDPNAPDPNAPPALPTSPAPTTPSVLAMLPSNSLKSPQFILGVYIVTIIAGVLAAIFTKGTDAAQNVALGFVFGAFASPIAFFFGASTGAQKQTETTALNAGKSGA